LGENGYVRISGRKYRKPLAPNQNKRLSICIGIQFYAAALMLIFVTEKDMTDTAGRDKMYLWMS
jgi:hypothetical protein